MNMPAELAIAFLGIAEPTAAQTAEFLAALRACKSKPGRRAP